VIFFNFYYILQKVGDFSFKAWALCNSRFSDKKLNRI
jgi:hypothetical protein